jgi:hypothetical protein
MVSRRSRAGKVLPDTPERVPAHTPASVNMRIEEEIARNVRRCAANPRMIEPRLRELDREWDVERVLEANAASLAFAGVALGATADRRLLWLPALVTGFLLQHALQGWCPPLPILRRLGFRTADEIGRERMALKALRGDFASVPKTGSPVARADAAMSAAGEGPLQSAAKSSQHRSAASPGAPGDPASVH